MVLKASSEKFWIGLQFETMYAVGKNNAFVELPLRVTFLYTKPEDF